VWQRTSVRFDPAFAVVRDDPRVQKLMSKWAAEPDAMRPAGKSAANFAPEKSVAVLAFTNLSDDKGNEYFSDDISEELLNMAEEKAFLLPVVLFFVFSDYDHAPARIQAAEAAMAQALRRATKWRSPIVRAPCNRTKEGQAARHEYRAWPDCHRAAHPARMVGRV
jgi:hypothetical protein